MAEPVALGSSVFDISCEELASEADLDSVFGNDPQLAKADSGDRPTEIFVTALQQDGALACNWGDRYAAPSMTLFALPDAAEGFDRFRPGFESSGYYRELDIFDGSFYHCAAIEADQLSLECEWQILADDVWVTVTLTGLLDAALDQQESDSDGSQSIVVSASSTLVSALSAAVDAVLQAPRRDLTRAALLEDSCSQLIDPVAIASTLAGTVEVFDLIAPGSSPIGITTAREGDPMWTVSMQRLGYRYCSVMPAPSDGFYATTVLVAPGGSWVFDESDAEAVDGLGSAIAECTSTSDGPFCAISVVVDGTLVVVKSNEASPEVSLAIAMNVVEQLS